MGHAGANAALEIGEKILLVAARWRNDVLLIHLAVVVHVAFTTSGPGLRCYATVTSVSAMRRAPVTP